MISNKLEKHYIGGKWVTPDSTTRMDVVNPTNGAVLGQIILANTIDTERAIQSAKGSFQDYAKTSKRERLGWLDRLLHISKRRLDETSLVISTEMGAPISMAKSAQAQSGIGHLEEFIHALRSQVERETLENGDDITREPIGVCGLITPWNWPINQISLKVVAALATGNTCVLKPSEYTPLSAILYSEMIEEAGFPAGVFNMVQGDGATAGATLSRSPLVDMVSFTGSTRAGIAVTKDSADTVKRVALELGGKSPNIVFADSELATQIEQSISECFYNTGQSCDAPTRMLVERSCLSEVLEIAESVGSAQQVGDPANEGNHLGPLVNDVQFERVQSWIKKGIEEGATLVCGGMGRPENFDAGYFVKPTIFSCDSNQSTIAQQEIFGPVLVIVPFDTEEEAVSMANDTPYGLAAYIQTGDIDRAERVASQLRAGAVHINGGEHRFGSPFGGYKQSGNGREGGVFGLENFQEIKTLHFG